MNEVKHSNLPFKITKSDHDNNGAHFYIDSRVEQYATEAEFESDRAFLELAANNHYTLTEQRDDLLAVLKHVEDMLLFGNLELCDIECLRNEVGLAITEAEAKS